MKRARAEYGCRLNLALAVFLSFLIGLSRGEGLGALWQLVGDAILIGLAAAATLEWAGYFEWRARKILQRDEGAS
jgi:hypothetical protein